MHSKYPKGSLKEWVPRKVIRNRCLNFWTTQLSWWTICHPSRSAWSAVVTLEPWSWQSCSRFPEVLTTWDCLYRRDSLTYSDRLCRSLAWKPNLTTRKWCKSQTSFSSAVCQDNLVKYWRKCVQWHWKDSRIQSKIRTSASHFSSPASQQLASTNLNWCWPQKALSWERRSTLLRFAST